MDKKTRVLNVLQALKELAEIANASGNIDWYKLALIQARLHENEPWTSFIFKMMIKNKTTLDDINEQWLEQFILVRK